MVQLALAEPRSTGVVPPPPSSEFQSGWKKKRISDKKLRQLWKTQ